MTPVKSIHFTALKIGQVCLILFSNLVCLKKIYLQTLLDVE